MSDEWRLLIEFDADGALEPVAKELVADLDEIDLHRAGDSLVAYADTPEEAHAAERLLRRELEKRGLAHLTSGVEHWNHEEEEWQDAQVRPTEPDDDRDDDDPDADNAHDFDEPGDPGSWMVRISVAHHRDAKRLAEELKAEGWVASSSWHTLEATTRSREEAETLASELDSRVPGGEPEIWASE